MNCRIKEVTRESGYLKCKIYADPRTCCAHDPPNHAEAISQELRMAVSKHSFASTRYRFQARACNTPAFRAVARSAMHRQRARRLAPWPRARPGARTATLPWRGGRGAGKGGPPPLPQRRRPAGVAQRPRAGPSPRRAAHLRTVGGAADTVHGWAGGIDRRAKGRF